jgi:hypothetical protein
MCVFLADGRVLSPSATDGQPPELFDCPRDCGRSHPMTSCTVLYRRIAACASDVSCARGRWRAALGKPHLEHAANPDALMQRIGSFVGGDCYPDEGERNMFVNLPRVRGW